MNRYFVIQLLCFEVYLRKNFFSRGYKHILLFFLLWSNFYFYTHIFNYFICYLMHDLSWDKTLIFSKWTAVLKPFFDLSNFPCTVVVCRPVLAFSPAILSSLTSGQCSVLPRPRGPFMPRAPKASTLPLAVITYFSVFIPLDFLSSPTQFTILFRSIVFLWLLCLHVSLVFVPVSLDTPF